MAELPPDEALIRDEIWDAARGYFDRGDWDKAIFDALKKVESLTQHQIRNYGAIGSPLFADAFQQGTPRIVISRDPKDLDSLYRLFAGAVGMYKGDRSHGDAPMVPVDSRAECLRILILASALLDILDHDEESAPKIQSVYPDSDRALSLRVDRLTPTTQFTVAGKDAVITSRRPPLVDIQLPDGAGAAFEILAVDRGRYGKPHRYEMPSSDENWHRVERIGAEVFIGPGLSEKSAVRVVTLCSHESGRRFNRTLPTRQAYSVGDYVTWEWDGSATASVAWMRDERGVANLAWESSAYFAGRVYGTAGPERLQSIAIRPSSSTTRVGERAPFRIFGRYGDGVGGWTKDVSAHVELETGDAQVVGLACTKDGRAAIGKAPGVSGITATCGAFHATAELAVKSVVRGESAAFLGGYQRLSKLANSPGGLLFSNQGDVIYELRRDLSVAAAIGLEVPSTWHTGIDNFAVAANGDVYLRAVWDGTVRRIASSRRAAGAVTRLPDGLVPMEVGWFPQTGALVGDQHGTVWSWSGENQLPCRWSSLPGICIAFVESPRGIFALLNTNLVVELDDSGKTIGEIDLSALTGKGPSGLASFDGGLFISCFNSGEIYEWADDGGTVLASGFNSPAALALYDGERLMVANFGGDSIAQVYL